MPTTLSIRATIRVKGKKIDDFNIVELTRKVIIIEYIIMTMADDNKQ